jgi:L-alanine-DL-glutamate epimerase-like enolase superfamily enzyme
MPNFLITEYFLNFEPIGNQIAVQPFQIEESYIELPTAPGLGIELDEGALAQRPYRAFDKRHLPNVGQEGP